MPSADKNVEQLELSGTHCCWEYKLINTNRTFTLFTLLFSTTVALLTNNQITSHAEFSFLLMNPKLQALYFSTVKEK